MPFIFTGSAQPAGVPAQRMMTFLEAVQTCLEKYFCFNGRASRSEYWWWVLAYGLPQALLYYGFGFVSALYVGGPPFYLSYNALCIVCGAGLVPGMAVSVRRLHDTGLSGWWLLFLYLPGTLAYALMLPWLGLIALCPIIYFQGRPSEKKANKYGDIPCTGSSQPDAPEQRRMSFTESVETCLKKSFWFKGRASRSEFWWLALAYAVALFLLTYSAVYCSLLYEKEVRNSLLFVLLAVSFIGFFPVLAACVRRLHDTGLSGWWLLLLCVPVISEYVLGTAWAFVVISCLFTYFLSRPSEKRANTYGDVPCLEAPKGAGNRPFDE